MRRINLLPWREQQRKDRQRAFFVGLGAATAAAVLATSAAYVWIGSMIEAQYQRNAMLRDEITRLDAQITEIDNLEAQKQKFIARMEIIDRLQRSRPEVVRVFETLVRTLPDGTYLTSVNQADGRIKLTGVAQSSTRVSTFMRNIDASEWLRNPELEIVENKSGNAFGSEFTLTVQQSSLLSDQSEAEGGAGQAKRGERQ
jgi:type IV pilus assembly protein PilN